MPIIRDLKKKGIPVKWIIIGEEGNCKNELIKRIDELNLEGDIIYYGRSSHINKWLMAFDCFVMPSIYEGFGIAALEAQASGLQCFLSDKIPKEIAVTDQVDFLSINNSDIWIQRISDYYAIYRDRKMNQSNYKKVKEQYDINTLLKDIHSLYLTV